ncbi:MAG: bifunctional (p)ppGpp synthetase/guanosine-3',5'-bis(diphosphate) 3'-pyrophosphohydrolase [Erysipelotrichia bacterium]|nr:bifunctional (p)ppGpp synthetase/guanosine-3',5'-bis(diphosphate) 3'-pyrophosphohydrolase [Erysipelotrichia bacterium]
MSKQKEVTKEMFFNEVAKYISDPQSIAMINKAYDFAQKAHEGQLRKSGEPYFIHVLNVAYILATLTAGPQTICAGLLHDTMEDCGVTFEEIETNFDHDIATLVEAVTKIGSLKFKDEKEYLAANHRKIFIAMAKDVRVIIIKLVDRLHNMRTLMYQPEEKQKKISSETLQVYAPIAHRLGLAEIKNELEDLSFLYLDPQKYHEIAHLLENKKSERQAIVNQMIVNLDHLLSDKKIEYRIFGRSKHIYSIYRKMITKNKRFDEIFDLYAIRIITKNELNCYEILGYIHNAYKPINGRLKDYIAMPKMNMYQSLHTTVLDGNGNIFEVQIRTEEMDMVAEMGIAAHWAYKEGKYNSAAEQKEIENKLGWFHDMISMMNESKLAHPTEFMSQIKKDIFEANVYVMTPKGRIIELQNGSTPLDFAYRVHTEVGHNAVGAIVNGALVPLDTVLKTGDVVQIKTSKQSNGPSEDWLKIVKTTTARNKIRAFLMKKENDMRSEMIAKGEKYYSDEVKRRNLDEKLFLDKSKLETIYGQLNINNYDELMYAVANKSISIAQIVEKLQKNKNTSMADNESLTKMIQEKQAKKDKRSKVSTSGVIVEGISSMMVNLAGCCMPVYGDEIVGYISKGQGVKVHRKDCPNIINEKNRLIKVMWNPQQQETQYDSWLRLDAQDYNYLINDIVTMLAQYKVSLYGIKSESLPDKVNTFVEIKVKVKDLEQLQTLMANLKKIEAVNEVTRITK